MKFSLIKISAIALSAALLVPAAYAATPGSVTPVPAHEGDGGYQDENDGWQEGDDWGQGDGWQDGDDWGQGDGWDNGGQNENFPREDRVRKPRKPRPGTPPRQGYQPRTHVETVQVRQYLYGYNRIPLFWLTNSISRLQGYRLKAITINGYSQWGMGGAFFCSSQCSMAQPIGGYYGSYPVRTTGERLNPYSGQWFLEIHGNFAIDTIQLEFVR